MSTPEPEGEKTPEPEGEKTQAPMKTVRFPLKKFLTGKNPFEEVVLTQYAGDLVGLTNLRAHNRDILFDMATEGPMSDLRPLKGCVARMGAGVPDKYTERVGNVEVDRQEVSLFIL